MSQELQYTLAVAYKNGNLKDSFASETFKVDQSAQELFAPVVVVGTVEEDLPASDVTTNGFLLVRNLDAANYVKYGPRGYTAGGDITGASNATPIVITSTAHGLANGDTVVIAGVAGNTAANGTWTVANVTANTFELSGSAGNGAYTSGGTWLKRALVEYGRIKPGETHLLRLAPGITHRWIANAAPVKVQTKLWGD